MKLITKPILFSLCQLLLICGSVTIANAEQTTTADFRMPVVDVFSITGRGVVLTGRIESGKVSVGDTICLSTKKTGDREVKVTGIELFRKVLESAKTGDTVGIMVEGIGKKDAAKGDELLAKCP